MKRFAVAAAAILLMLATVPGTAVSAEAPHDAFQQARFSHPLKINNPYFPLVSGTRYIYRGMTEGASTYEVLIVTSDSKVVSGVTARVVEDRSWESGHLVEKTFDWYAQDDAGNVWYLGEYTTEYDHGQVVSHEGSWKAGTNGAVAGMIMEAHPKAGDAYRQEFLAGVAEDSAKVLTLNASLCVTYGCFSNVLKTQETTALEPGVVEVKYYARGIGEMRSKLVQGGSEENHLVKVVKP